MLLCTVRLPVLANQLTKCCPAFRWPNPDPKKCRVVFSIFRRRKSKIFRRGEAKRCNTPSFASKGHALVAVSMMIVFKPLVALLGLVALLSPIFSDGVTQVQDFLSNEETLELLAAASLPHNHAPEYKRAPSTFGKGTLSSSIMARLCNLYKQCQSTDSFSDTFVSIKHMTETTDSHADRFVMRPDRKIVDDAVAFIMLNTNKDATFIHGNEQVPVQAGNLVSFRGSTAHHTVVNSGHVKIAGPFHVASMEHVGGASFGDPCCDDFSCPSFSCEGIPDGVSGSFLLFPDTCQDDESGNNFTSGTCGCDDVVGGRCFIPEDCCQGLVCSPLTDTCRVDAPDEPCCNNEECSSGNCKGGPGGTLNDGGSECQFDDQMRVMPGKCVCNSAVGAPCGSNLGCCEADNLICGLNNTCQNNRPAQEDFNSFCCNNNECNTGKCGVSDPPGGTLKGSQCQFDDDSFEFADFCQCNDMGDFCAVPNDCCEGLTCSLSNVCQLLSPIGCRLEDTNGNVLANSESRIDGVFISGNIISCAVLGEESGNIIDNCRSNKIIDCEFIQCFDFACDSTNISKVPEGGRVQCIGESSCQSAEIEIGTDDDDVKSFKVDCDGPLSCNSTQIRTRGLVSCRNGGSTGKESCFGAEIEAGCLSCSEDGTNCSNSCSYRALGSTRPFVMDTCITTLPCPTFTTTTADPTTTTTTEETTTPAGTTSQEATTGDETTSQASTTTTAGTTPQASATTGGTASQATTTDGTPPQASTTGGNTLQQSTTTGGTTPQSMTTSQVTSTSTNASTSDASPTVSSTTGASPTEATTIPKPTPEATPKPTQKPSPDDDCKPKLCDPSADEDSCDAHSSCSVTCVPKFCKIPENGHKIHGPPSSYATGMATYKKLGDVCGWFHYVQGSRHDVEVCCDVEYTRDDPYYAECSTCDACIYPQKVNDACCLAEYNGISDRMERAGDFHGCPSHSPVCCKCGSDDYACIGEDEDCTTTVCSDESRFLLEDDGLANTNLPKHIRTG